MDATPFEQVVVVAVATYGTGELTVSPFVGLLTVTLARAGAANIKSVKTTEWNVFMALPSAIYLERAHSGIARSHWLVFHPRCGTATTGSEGWEAAAAVQDFDVVLETPKRWRISRSLTWLLGAGTGRNVCEFNLAGTGSNCQSVPSFITFFHYPRRELSVAPGPEPGFSTIRIPLHSKYFKTDDDEGFKLIDQLSKWRRQEHIYRTDVLHRPDEVLLTPCVISAKC
jgi:hypothetical protein